MFSATSAPNTPPSSLFLSLEAKYVKVGQVEVDNLRVDGDLHVRGDISAEKDIIVTETTSLDLRPAGAAAVKWTPGPIGCNTFDPPIAPAPFAQAVFLHAYLNANTLFNEKGVASVGATLPLTNQIDFSCAPKDQVPWTLSTAGEIRVPVAGVYRITLTGHFQYTVSKCANVCLCFNTTAFDDKPIGPHAPSVTQFSDAAGTHRQVITMTGYRTISAGALTYAPVAVIQAVKGIVTSTYLLAGSSVQMELVAPITDAYGPSRAFHLPE
jgi:hypothetical protein